MKTDIDCFPCFLKQTAIAFRLVSADESVWKDLLKDVLPLMQDMDLNKPPAYFTTFLHRAIRKRLGQDPFKKIKYEYNEIAMGLFQGLQERVKRSKDPLLTASRFAIAGNIIDFGIFTSIDIESSIAKAVEADIAVDDYIEMKRAADKADTILYLLDNSGEIVFDKLLIGELVSMGKKVKAVVKGAPVLNDVTYDDAAQTGLAEICEVINNGSDAIGTILEWTSPVFQTEFDRAELVISKGQGNFETLWGTGKKIYYLFQSKCNVVSQELGLLPGSMLLKKS